VSCVEGVASKGLTRRTVLQLCCSVMQRDVVCCSVLYHSCVSCAKGVVSNRLIGRVVLQMCQSVMQYIVVCCSIDVCVYYDAHGVRCIEGVASTHFIRRAV